jgi:hypothetical protein
MKKNLLLLIAATCLVLPILRTTLGHFLVEILKHFADVKMCYITGNNSQSYSGY